jgi:hypothetical protein
MIFMIKKHSLLNMGTRIILAGLGALFILGCSTGEYARMKVSRDVVRDFETYQIFPGHRYFYLKQQNAPFALLALRDEYTISSMNWYEMDTGSKEFAATVDFAKSVAEDYYYPMGMIIQSPQGDQIGYWYSGLRIKGIAVDEEKKSVSIYTNTPWLDDVDWGG